MHLCAQQTNVLLRRAAAAAAADRRRRGGCASLTPHRADPDPLSAGPYPQLRNHRSHRPRCPSLLPPLLLPHIVRLFSASLPPLAARGLFPSPRHPSALIAVSYPSYQGNPLSQTDSWKSLARPPHLQPPAHPTDHHTAPMQRARKRAKRSPPPTQSRARKPTPSPRAASSLSHSCSCSFLVQGRFLREAGGSSSTDYRWSGHEASQ